MSNENFEIPKITIHETSQDFNLEKISTLANQKLDSTNLKIQVLDIDEFKEGSPQRKELTIC